MPLESETYWAQIAGTQRKRPGEWIVEKVIFLTSFSAILMIFLIFLFVAREAWPVLAGRINSAQTQKVIPPEQLPQLSPAQIRAYLGLTEAQFRQMDRETLKTLMELKVETAQTAPRGKDAAVNSLSWRLLLRPYRWSDYDKPAYIWQPVSDTPKYNLVPLMVGSLKTTLVALLFSVPLSLGAAIYVSQLASPKSRELLKPAIELLAGIPSVVLGFFALIVMASFVQRIFHFPSRLNAFVAGMALALAVIPLIFSIAEDALTSVPGSYLQAALALGSSRWQAAWHIILPAALPGVFAGVVLGFGRAVGETMIVLMASGNASVLSASLFDSTRSMTATIAAELAETVFGGPHYRILFLIGLILFVVTFLSNLAGVFIIERLKKRLGGKV